MITIIDDLTNYITTVAAVNCSFGNRDLAPDEYPHIQIIPNQSINTTEFASVNFSLQFGVMIKLTTDRKNERTAIDIYLKLISALRNFQKCQGHEVQTPAVCEYQDSSYTISFNLNLRYITGA